MSVAVMECPPRRACSEVGQIGHRVGRPLAFTGTSRLARQEAEFTAFVARYEQPLFGHLRRLLPTREVAHETVQEALLRAWVHFDEVRTYRRPDAWLYRVATNLALSHLRRKQMLCFSQLASRGQGEGEDDDWTPAETAADPLDVEAQTAQRDLIVRALAGLPDRYRTVLLLRAVYDRSWEEIADALGTTTGNARQLLSRARQRFCLLYEAA